VVTGKRGNRAIGTRRKEQRKGMEEEGGR